MRTTNYASHRGTSPGDAPVLIPGNSLRDCWRPPGEQFHRSQVGRKRFGLTLQCPGSKVIQELLVRQNVSVKSKRAKGPIESDCDIVIINSSGKPQFFAAMGHANQEMGSCVVATINQEHQSDEAAWKDLQAQAGAMGGGLLEHMRQGQRKVEGQRALL